MSWQAWLLDKALRFTMKRHGDRPVDPVALRARLAGSSQIGQGVAR